MGRCADKSYFLGDVGSKATTPKTGQRNPNDCLLCTTLPDYQDQSSTTKQWQKTFLSHHKFCCQSSDNFFIMVPPPFLLLQLLKLKFLSILFWLYHETAKYAKALFYSSLFWLEMDSTLYHEHSVIYLWTFPLILMIDIRKEKKSLSGAKQNVCFSSW